MKFLQTGIIFLVAFFIWVSGNSLAQSPIPPGLINFDAGNVVFRTNAGGWDENIRERGWIIYEENTYHLWYTGYTGWDILRLGYATSPDGVNWNRYPGNPLLSDDWVEDMCVLKDGDTYYMVCEGLNDRPQLLSSTDRVNWTHHGPLKIYEYNSNWRPHRSHSKHR